MMRVFYIVCWFFFLSLEVYAQRIDVVRSNEGVELSENGKKVLFYQYVPKSMDGQYQRAGYVHPLYTLAGNVMTEDFPGDHPYHHGIFWAWHQIILDDKKVADGWVSENITWKPLRLDIKPAKNRVEILAKQEWDVRPAAGGIMPIIREYTSITVFSSTGHWRVLDFDIRLYALVDQLKLGGSDDVKGYGGFCWRLKLPGDISFLSGDSLVTPAETAVVAGPWMDCSGSFDGKDATKSGIAIFCGVSQALKRQRWILRRTGSMQNVEFPGRAPAELPRSGWRLRYRLIVHDQTVTAGMLEKLYRVYQRRWDITNKERRIVSDGH